MDWLSSNWTVLGGWIVTLSIAIAGWMIEARNKRKGDEASAERIRELEEANKNLQRQAAAQEELARAAAEKPREEPFGDPEIVEGSIMRLRNGSPYPVFVDSFDGEPLLERPKNVPGVIAPKESIEFMPLFAWNASTPQVTVKWRWKDRPGKENVSRRICHK